MKIYIVTTGSYSDYGIDAVFSIEEKVEAYARAQGFDKNPFSHWDIDEQEVDPKEKT